MQAKNASKIDHMEQTTGLQINKVQQDLSTTLQRGLLVLEANLDAKMAAHMKDIKDQLEKNNSSKIEIRGISQHDIISIHLLPLSPLAILLIIIS